MRHHRYSNMSNLNAAYDDDALRGLGGTHQYYDVSDLAARWDQIPEQAEQSKLERELGAGILAAGALGSLGAETAGYPWKQYSKDTLALQTEINAWLKEHGYCPISADGKLGPTTCGAAAFYRDESGYGGAKSISGGVPSTCTSFSYAPSKPPCPGATAPAPAPAPSPDLGPAAATPATATISGGGGDWMWLAVGGLVAAAAIGGAIYYKKKKKG